VPGHFPDEETTILLRVDTLRQRRLISAPLTATPIGRFFDKTIRITGIAVTALRNIVTKKKIAID
jgi:hypothetical protein